MPLISYDPKLDQIRENLARDGKDTSQIDAIITLYQLINVSRLDESNISFRTESWSTPTLLNDWVSYGAPASIEGYYKDQFNKVLLKGVIKNGTVNIDDTGDTNVILILPLGYRPSERIYFAATSNNDFGYVRVDPDGKIRAKAGSNTWFSLSNIIFKAEQ